MESNKKHTFEDFRIDSGLSYKVNDRGYNDYDGCFNIIILGMIAGFIFCIGKCACG